MTKKEEKNTTMGHVSNLNASQLDRIVSSIVVLRQVFLVGPERDKIAVRMLFLRESHGEVLTTCPYWLLA